MPDELSVEQHLEALKDELLKFVLTEAGRISAAQPGALNTGLRDIVHAGVTAAVAQELATVQGAVTRLVEAELSNFRSDASTRLNAMDAASVKHLSKDSEHLLQELKNLSSDVANIKLTTSKLKVGIENQQQLSRDEGQYKLLQEVKAYVEALWNSLQERPGQPSQMRSPDTGSAGVDQGARNAASPRRDDVEPEGTQPQGGERGDGPSILHRRAAIRDKLGLGAQEDASDGGGRGGRNVFVALVAGVVVIGLCVGMLLFTGVGRDQPVPTDELRGQAVPEAPIVDPRDSGWTMLIESNPALRNELCPDGVEACDWGLILNAPSRDIREQAAQATVEALSTHLDCPKPVVLKEVKSQADVTKYAEWERCLTEGDRALERKLPEIAKAADLQSAPVLEALTEAGLWRMGLR